MADTFPEGDWLLIDAAGPLVMVGLISRDHWLHYEKGEGDLLEWLFTALDRLTGPSGRPLTSLRGALYASGPGSTLGLRLAAMSIRSFLSHPSLRHWTCLQYHNLEAALAGGPEIEPGVSLVAPWRRDRWHRTTLVSCNPLQFRNDSIQPPETSPASERGILLGRRPPAESNRITWDSYPSEQLPGILCKFPELLHPVRQPLPYLAEEPEFVRWSPKRHSAK